jgi:hypothetical protein
MRLHGISRVIAYSFLDHHLPLCAGDGLFPLRDEGDGFD